MRSQGLTAIKDETKVTFLVGKYREKSAFKVTEVFMTEIS